MPRKAQLRERKTQANCVELHFVATMNRHYSDNAARESTRAGVSFFSKVVEHPPHYLGGKDGELGPLDRLTSVITAGGSEYRAKHTGGVMM